MIVITIDDAAFDGVNREDPQVDGYSQKILELLSTADFYEDGLLRDSTGNTVGMVEVNSDRTNAR